MLEGRVREPGEGVAGALMRCAGGSIDEEEDAAVERLVLECAGAYCPIQPLAPRPVPEERGRPGFCAALPPDPERWGRWAMPTGEDDAKRRRAFAEGLLPSKCAAARELSDGGRIEAHMVELDALAGIAAGGQTAWDVLAAESLADKHNGLGCAVADGDLGACPGWCAMAIAGFEGGWVMAS